MDANIKFEKTITINVMNPNNITVVAAGCDGQDLYRGLCALLAHMKTKLIEPQSVTLKSMVEIALQDIEKMERNL